MRLITRLFQTLLIKGAGAEKPILKSRHKYDIMKQVKLDIEEIVPADDLINEEIDSIVGGSSENHFCIKGCVTGSKTDPQK